jgi:citronellol/citronellal dehydrogenase
MARENAQADAMNMTNRVAFITGASRGVGRACAFALARAGAHVVVAAKTAEPHPKLPGTIHETAKAVEALGRQALPIALDVRDAAACEAAVAHTISRFGRLDVLINNAGALWWADVIGTPVKRFDLIMGVNVRAAFVLSHAVLPHMVERRWGHIVMMSPPIDADAVAHHGAYAVSKFGMTMLAAAIAQEHRQHNIAAHALWPATMIESSATEVHLGQVDKSMWRSADILADATLALVQREPGEQSGQAWIDEDVLRRDGIADFKKYRLNPDVEPPRFSFKDIPPISA